MSVPAIDYAPGLRPLQPGEDHQQRRLAAARRADEAERLPAVDREADLLEDMDLARTGPEADMNVLAKDDWSATLVVPYIACRG